MNTGGTSAGSTGATKPLPHADQLDGFEVALEEYHDRRGWTDEGRVLTDAVPA